MANIGTHVSSLWNEDSRNQIKLERLNEDLRTMKKIRSKLSALYGFGSKGFILQAINSFEESYGFFSGTDKDGKDWGYTHDNGKTTVDTYTDGSGTYNIKKINEKLYDYRSKVKKYLDSAEVSISKLEKDIKNLENKINQS